MPRAWREILLLIVGIGIGYTLAVTTKAANVPMLDRARQYIATRQMEAFVFLILIGVIIYLAGGKGGRR